MCIRDRAPEELRMFLYQNGYKILDEHLVREEHRLYEIIVCKYEGLEPQEIDPIYYEIGLKLIENNDPLLNDFIENKIRINQNAVSYTHLSSKRLIFFWHLFLPQTYFS